MSFSVAPVHSRYEQCFSSLPPESRWDGFVRFRNLIGISSSWRLLNRPRFAEMHTRAKKRFRLFHVLRVQDSLGFNESRVTHHSCEDFRRSGSIPDSGIPGFEGIGFAVTPCPLGINRPDLLELIRVYF